MKQLFVIFDRKKEAEQEEKRILSLHSSPKDGKPAKAAYFLYICITLLCAQFWLLFH